MGEATQKPIAKFDSLEAIYLIYLALLPTAGTLFFLEKITIPGWARFFIFIIGVAGVALYLATIVSYSLIPPQWWKRLVFIIDGPLLAVGMAYFLTGTIIDIIMNMFFIDVGGAVLGILITVIKKAPSKTDRIKGLIATGIPFAAILLALPLYAKVTPGFSVIQLGLLLIGLCNTGFIQSRIFQKENVLRECPQIIILGIALWTAAYIFGCVYWGDLRKKANRSQESGARNQALRTSNMSTAKKINSKIRFCLLCNKTKYESLTFDLWIE